MRLRGAEIALLAKLSRGRAGINPHHPQRVQRAGVDSDWSELYFCHKRIKALTFRGYVGIHPPTMGMYIWIAFLPGPWLLVILLLVWFLQMSHSQKVLRELLFDAWVESVLPCHKRQDALSHGAFVSLWDKTQPEGSQAI